MKINNLTKIIAGNLALLASLLLLTPNAAHAAAFTPGNLVVVQVGTGSGALASSGTAAFLNEYTTAGASVQQIALPTTTVGANVAFVLSGTATSEGFIFQTTNGLYVVMAGYNAAVGTAGITTSIGNRTVARVDRFGNVDTTTVLNDAANIGNSRSAASDNGANIWVGSSSGGMRYTPFGSTAASTQLNSAAPTNLRVANVFNGQLYVSSATSPLFGVGTMGTGLPTTSGQTPALLPGFPTVTGPSSYGFWFKDASTLYVADDRATGGGIQKWTLSGGTWSNPYNVTTTGCRGLIGTVVGGTTILYATTTATSANTLVTVTDTGAPVSPTILATAPVNTAFRGVAFGPVPPLALSSIAAPAAGPLTRGGNNQPVFGFKLTPTATSATFSTLALTTTGTATSSDMNTFQVVQDVNGNGLYDGGDIIVSTASQPLSGTINFTIDATTQSGFTTNRQYLVIANVAAGATSGATFTGSIASGGAGASPTAEGTALGNRQTIGVDMTMAAVASSESATISSLVNDAGPLTSSSGVQAWQVLFNNPAGNAGAGTISALTFTKGAGNTVTNWSTVIQAADLFDGSTHLASGTITADNIAFSGLSVLVADGGSKTLSLRISLVSTPTLTDNTVLQFALTETGVTCSGNNVITPSINSAAGQNKITVTATKLAFTTPNPSTIFYAVVNRAFNGTVQAQDANGNVDLDASSGVTVTKASGPGNFTYGGAASLTQGSVSWTTSTSSGFKFDATGDYTLTATSDGGLTAATSGTIRVVAAATMTEVFMPQYMAGTNNAGGSARRLPFAYRVTLGGLTPNATYRYWNMCANPGSDGPANAPTSDGAGNYILVDPITGIFAVVNSSNRSFSDPTTYGTFTTDGSGNYTGWFMVEPTTNARFNDPNTPVYMQIELNNGADGTFVLHRVRSALGVTPLAWGTATDGTAGTGIRGNSFAPGKNFVLLYDNTDPTGLRPLAGTVLESDGVAETGSYVGFYTNVDGISGAWGAIIPNNTTGVKRIEQRALSDGTQVGIVATDADGVWPSGANTVGPLTGADATPIVITGCDAPLAAFTPAAQPHITQIQVSGGTVLIDFTGGACNETPASFTVVGGANLTVPLAPIAAIITSPGPDQFRATITGTTPPAFYRIKK